jgi:UrcA family protein
LRNPQQALPSSHLHNLVLHRKIDAKSTTGMTTERRPKAQMKEQAMRKSIVTVLAALAVSALGAVPATAADEVKVTVPYADLDLTAPAGSAALDQRIDAAVKQVCARPDIRNLKAMTAWEECKASAKLDALDQLSIASPYEDVELASVF